MTQAPENPNERFDRLESALGRLAELSFNNAARHDRAIDQLLEVTARNSENINRMEQAITNLTNTVASSNIRIEQNNARIEQILEYLRNRNGGSNPL